MKITKERLRELIKEELAELEQEVKSPFLSTGDITGAEVGYGRGQTSSESDNVSMMFDSLLNPIIWQNRTQEPREDWLKDLVNKKTKGMQPEQIQAAIKKVEKLADFKRGNVSEESLPAFESTVKKLKSALQQKIQSVPEVPLKMDQSKIKVTFGKN